MDPNSLSPEQLSRPTGEQLQWLDAEFGIFIHFSINTYANKEWSDGTFSPSIYNPTKLDCNQWVRTAQAIGAKYMILVCKHHDGFCNWQTATTDYSVKSSPWRDGQGDTVEEFVAACRKANMKFGFYLSPWDRHEPKYKDKEAYDKFYAQQLEELVRDYAKYDEIFELWFDGAGSVGREYDWKSIMAVVKKYQPHAMIFNMGNLTIRWCGNEHGFATYPLWNGVYSAEKLKFSDGKGGSGIDGDQFIPAECDVPIRLRFWFHHSGFLGILYRKMLQTKSRLIEVYEKSIGRGGNLLLNIAPTKEGLFNDLDISRAKEWATAIKERYGSPIAKTSGKGKIITLELDATKNVAAVWTMEDLSQGQRVLKYHIEAKVGGNWQKIPLEDSGISIGHKKIDRFPSPIITDSVRLVIEECVGEPQIREFAAFK